MATNYRYAYILESGIAVHEEQTESNQPTLHQSELRRGRVCMKDRHRETEGPNWPSVMNAFKHRDPSFLLKVPRLSSSIWLLAVLC